VSKGLTQVGKNTLDWPSAWAPESARRLGLAAFRQQVGIAKASRSAGPRAFLHVKPMKAWLNIALIRLPLR